nr:fe(3+) ions import ATP-binding protein FbpC 1-like [Nerophis lumbriciformis]
MKALDKTAALELHGIELWRGDHLALGGVDFDAEPAQLTVLVGPSGCGKTSLLRAVAGFEAPHAGSVKIGGELVCGPGCWIPPERRRVGMVFQQGALFPHLKVLDNVLYGLSRGDGRQQRAAEVLELVGMAELAGRYPDELSGGEQQRVALARALAPEPRLVLLDEPFAALDAGLRKRVRDEVCLILRRAGATAILVTHDQEEALSIADRVVVMHAGRILQSGRPEEVYQRPNCAEVARFLGDGQLLDCEVRRGEAVSSLGRVSCSLDDGPAQLLVRPEDLDLQPAGAEEGGYGDRSTDLLWA